MVAAVEIGLIIIFSLIGGVLATRFKQPTVLGLLLIGAIVGPSTLGLIKDTTLINEAIEIGAVLLLFTIGIEFSLDKIIRFGVKASIISLIKIGVLILGGYYVGMMFGLDFITSIAIGIIISITSTVILIKTLEQKGFAKREEMPLLVTILIIEDIVAVGALTFISALNTQADIIPVNFISQFLFSAGVIITAYLILKKILRPAIEWAIRYSSEETTTFIALGLCIGMSYLSYMLEFSPAIGAFLAGNIVASLHNAKEFEKAIDPFILTFTSLFFFAIGTTVNFSSLPPIMWLIAALVVVGLLLKSLIIGFGSYFFAGYNGRQAIFASLAMIPIGEFSLLVAREASAVNSSIDLVSMTAAIIFITTLILPLVIGKSEKLYIYFSHHIPSAFRQHVRATSSYLSKVSSLMEKYKTISKEMLRRLHTLEYQLAGLFIIGAVWVIISQNAISWRSAIESYPLIWEGLGWVLWAVIIVLCILVIRNFYWLRNEIKTFTAQYMPEDLQKGKNQRVLMLVGGIVLTLFLSLILPEIVYLLGIDNDYNMVNIILMLVLFFFIFRLLYTVPIGEKNNPVFALPKEEPQRKVTGKEKSRRKPNGKP